MILGFIIGLFVTPLAICIAITAIVFNSINHDNIYNGHRR